MNGKITKFFALLGGCCMAFSTVGCKSEKKSGSGGGNVTPPPDDEAPAITAYKDNSDSNGASGFNNRLWYRNDLKVDMGDPMLVFDDATSLFYALGTRGGTSFDVFESADLNSWNKKTSGGFTPSNGSWGKTSLWAPDVQKIGNKWYLYYTANYKNPDPLPQKPNENHCQIGVAVADSPAGPFVQWTGTNFYGKSIGENDLPFYGMEHETILDQHVFQDDDGQLYMYFSYDTQYSPNAAELTQTAEIWGVKMKDPVTWEMDETTGRPKIERLIVAGYKTLAGANKREIPWETASPSFIEPMECVEGPYMIKRASKYYLTYCANSFVDMEYSVGYAESDSPLGPFTKPNDTYLQNMLCGVPTEETGTYISNRYKGFMTGTGHASVCKVGSEYLLAYHAHLNRDAWGVDSPFATGGQTQWRALGYDYILFDPDSGRPYCNGPTYTLQKLPDLITGYTNLAPSATVTIDGKASADCKYINDNYTNRAIKTDEANREAQFAAGKHTITLTLPQAKLIKAVNVYNSYDRAKSFKVISRLSFGKAGYISNLRFNESYLINTYTSGGVALNMNFIYPHAAFNIELTNKGVTTDTVTITIENDKAFAVGEIEILGK